jgi:hypothetical protein
LAHCFPAGHSPDLIHLFCAGEKPEFLRKAGFKLPVFNPPETKTGGLRAGSDHGSVATEEEDVP